MNDKITYSMSGLIALMLSFNYDFEKWMDKVLSVILKYRKHNDIIKELTTDYFEEFRKTHRASSNFTRV